MRAAFRWLVKVVDGLARRAGREKTFTGPSYELSARRHGLDFVKIARAALAA
jgi:hypothetical protein